MKKLFVFCFSAFVLACGTDGKTHSNPNNDNKDNDSGAVNKNDQNNQDSGSVNQDDASVNTSDASTTNDNSNDSGTTDAGFSDGGFSTDGGNGDCGSGNNLNDASDPSDGSNSCTVHSCVYTQGYYKTHNVSGLTLGNVYYSSSEVLNLLNEDPYGDDSVILAKQLIAALFNGGACDPNAASLVQSAQDWMVANKDADGKLPYDTMCVDSNDPGCVAGLLGMELDSYNSGNDGTPHCQ